MRIQCRYMSPAAALAPPLRRLQCRYMSPGAPLARRQASPPAKPLPLPVVAYEGGLATALRGFKLASLGVFCVSTLGAPLVSLHSYPQFPLLAKSAFATTMVAVSALSTVTLHWFAGPYVSKLHWERGQPHFEVETLSILGRSTRSRIYFADVTKPPKKSKAPLVTFSAHGKHFFVEEDGFPDEELWNKLVKGRKKQVGLFF